MYGYIYRTTNLINNKIYIGQKKSDLFLGESYLGSGVKLSSAIQHYGKENFSVDLIDVADSKDELDSKEKEYIKLYNSQDDSIGYNLADGGEGGYVGYTWNKGLTKETDSRLCQSEDTKRKRSESLKRAYKEGRHNINFTSEVRRKMSEKAKQREHKPTTLGRKSMTNGVDNKMVTPDMFDYYISLGYYFGKTCNMTAWNKGLTKETDERVRKLADEIKKFFEDVGSIGCYGVKGNTYAKKKS